MNPALERKQGKEERMKGDAGAEATVIPYKLYKEITNKPLPKVQSAESFLLMEILNHCWVVMLL